MIAFVALATAAVYSNVFMHPESGDMLGMEIRIHHGAQSIIDFALCEGGCYGANGIVVEQRHDGFDFVYDQKLVDQKGKSIPSDVLRFSARFWHGRLVVTQFGTASETLKPRRRPWGLNLIDSISPAVP